MPGGKNSRDKKAHDEDNRQRRREITTELERRDEPPVHEEALAELSEGLTETEFPVTGAEVLRVVTEMEVETGGEGHAFEDLIPDTESYRFESTEELYRRLGRPTVASALRRVVETADDEGVEFGAGQVDAYRRTFLALRDMEVDDEDGGVEEIADRIVESLGDGKGLPSSRRVRRWGAEYCRDRGHRVSTEDWLGI